MKKYWSLWKRGWWAWWMMLCANLFLGALFLPIALLTRGHKELYWTIALGAGIVIGLPVWGWLFDRIATASGRLPPTIHQTNSSVT